MSDRSLDTQRCEGRTLSRRGGGAWIKS
jgi:hypothetical protein